MQCEPFEMDIFRSRANAFWTPVISCTRTEAITAESMSWTWIRTVRQRLLSTGQSRRSATAACFA